jgi:hypothetical protein
MVPLAISIVPAVQADAGEAPAPAVETDLVNPQEGAEGTLTYVWPPYVVGYYYLRGKFTVYDWAGNKVEEWRDEWLHIMCQDTGVWFPEHLLQHEWKAPAYPAPGQTPIGIMPSSEDITSPQIKLPQASCGAWHGGYVGSMLVDDKLKVKNKPRLSLYYYDDYGSQFLDYPTHEFATEILNAYVKVDRKTGAVKSIKGTLQGWGLHDPPLADGSASWNQYEFKFNGKWVCY